VEQARPFVIPRDEANIVASWPCPTSQVPAGRFGNASEIAQAMVFVASDEAAFSVGSELVIDGGMSTL
jgi:NAD(P)-dependent dehydrogenase (short-subunit alcohol dehydrogenase family)